MTRVAFRWISREHLIALAIILLVSAICLIISSDPAHGADQPAIKQYNPFDEPKPAIPREMLSDKRLDRKVQVSAKGMNLKALLGELSAVSGVKLSVDPKIESERPIIFFRNRSLRDVMSELSGFYGYTWLAKPDRYELIEDAQHIKARSDRVAEGKKKSDALLLDFTKKYLVASPDDENIKKLAVTNNMAYQSLFGPTGKFTSAMLSSLGEDVLARGLTESGVNMGFSETPAAFQSAYCEWSNASIGRRWHGGDQAPPATPSDPASMASQKVAIRRSEGGSSSFSRLLFSVTSPTGNATTFDWPSSRLRYDDLSAVAGWIPDETMTAPGNLPSVNISPPIPETRLWLTASDILQAIAEQSGKDVIADNIREEQQGPLIAGVPLGALVEQICRDQGYACQADGDTLRLRLSQWYSQPLLVEAPTELLETCYGHLEKDGKLSISDLVALASLPPDQMQSPEVRNMPGARDALRSPAAFRLWVSLTDAKVSADGIPVAGLSAEQRKLLDGWIATGRNAVAPEKVAGAVLVVTTERTEGGYRGIPTEYQQLSLKSGDEVLAANPIFLSPPLSDDDRLALIETRKADREADVIKALN